METLMPISIFAKIQYLLILWQIFITLGESMRFQGFIYYFCTPRKYPI